MMEIVHNDNDLVRGFRNAEEAAVRQVYNMYYRPLCYFAEQLVHDKQEAEDIAIETFLKLLNKKTDFDKLPDIKSFLFIAARNACFDYLRKSKVKDKSNREFEYLSEPDPVFGEEEMIAAKVLQVIYAEVEALPGQCRQVFKSVFIEGKNTATIASEMGISAQTVLNQKAKALQVLRLSLYREGLYSAGALLFGLFLISNQHSP